MPETAPPSAPPTARSAPAPGMLGVQLRYGIGSAGERAAALTDSPFELLAAVAQGGSIRQAARTLGASYRHVWGSLRRWEALLGQPLIAWSQGQRARPTPFAERLLWAERRARGRMQPHVEELRADFARVLADACDERHQLLTVRASHDLALPVLQRHVAASADLHVDIGFQGSADALRSLNAAHCQVAGFHVPALRGAAPEFARALKPLLKPRLHRLIACSRRMQGLMVRREHAALVRTFPDLARQGLRFVNRQPGSGTRLLVDHLLHEHSVAPDALAGYREHIELTHAAVALCVAGGVADAGIGVEAAALQLGLHFIPLVEEDYFLACLEADAVRPAVMRLRESLAGAGWRQILASLPGYRPPEAPGVLLAVEQALPWWRNCRPHPPAGTGAP
ncbi:MAG TPA: substrate-binding domain-containing protein [Steroidobacteraceae bacterium]|nr:substrate-binding domain-containing protein [Steroidobacteraceae bacterium]